MSPSWCDNGSKQFFLNLPVFFRFFFLYTNVFIHVASWIRNWNWLNHLMNSYFVWKLLTWNTSVLFKKKKTEFIRWFLQSQFPNLQFFLMINCYDFLFNWQTEKKLFFFFSFSNVWCHEQDIFLKIINLEHVSFVQEKNHWRGNEPSVITNGAKQSHWLFHAIDCWIILSIWL